MDDVDEGIRVLFAVLSFLFLPVFVLFGRRGGMKAEYHAVRVQIPSCSLCEKQEVRIVEFDTHRKTMRIAVHKTLASAMESQRSIAK